MRKSFEKIAGAVRIFWLWLREWCGDAAYERYQRATARREGDATITREQFYVQQLERKYSRPSRCC
jgi:uncharacterized short protein YbdD (DUF466 family)